MDDQEQSNASKPWRLKANRPVFFSSAALILLFALLGSLFSDQAGELFDQVQAFIVRDFGWFYITAVAGFLVFVLYLLFSRYGDIRLGPDDCEPEYGYVSWFAMLFSAGMGIGLVFFGVAEPIQHYAEPPVGDPRSVEAARQSLVLTFFHWGLHAWAIYVVVGLSLAYFAFRRGLPLTIRSALYPLIGRRINGPIGDVIDVFAVLGTMFGVATSLGLGVLQVNAGMAELFGLPTARSVQLVLIAAITGLATLSVIMGLDRGIKRLSELNIIVAIALLAFVLVTGSTVFLLQAFVQNVGAYLGSIVPRTFRMYAYEPNPWLGDWTLFYWGWWIAWSPFVGMFIARISRGRTIKEFVSGVLLVPVAFTFFWMTVFGNTAIDLDSSGVAPLAQTVADNLPVALFEMLEELPLSAITSGLATLLIMTFFVTSADSGALVIDTITSGGSEDSPVWQRVFWAVCAGAVAAVLLVAGGLEALQTAAIASALPFAVIMVFICYGLLRALQREPLDRELNLSAPVAGAPSVNWQQKLANIVHLHSEDELSTFMSGTVKPALESVAEQMRQHGLTPEVQQDGGQVALTVAHGQERPFRYRVHLRGYRPPSFTWAEPAKERSREHRHFRAMAETTARDRPHDVTGLTQQQLINDLLGYYGAFRQPN